MIGLNTNIKKGAKVLVVSSWLNYQFEKFRMVNKMATSKTKITL
jgi:hypothetical protein